MLLNDAWIRKGIETGWIGIDPFDPKSVQPASIDLTLGNEFRVMDTRLGKIDPYEDSSGLYTLVEVKSGDPFVLWPGGLVLGSTVERITLPADIQGRLDGKSSLARLGLMVHQTGGFFDPGFDAPGTLEFSCVSPMPIKLWPGMRIAQMSFEQLVEPAERPYGHKDLGSKYQGQQGPVPSRYHLNDRPS